jgi:hypothetical protein
VNLSAGGNTQFMWSVKSSIDQIDIDSLLIMLYEELGVVIQEESDKRPILSVLFLENMANFVGQIDQKVSS